MRKSIVSVVSLDIYLLKIMFDFFLYLVLVLQNVLEFVVLVDWLGSFEDLEQFVLLFYDVLDLFRFEVFVDLTFYEVSSEFLCVVLVLFLVFLYFAVEA